MVKKIVKKKVKTAKKKSWNNQLYIVLIGMIVLIGVLLLVYYLMQSRYHINYNGLAFTKEKYGALDVYHYYYYFVTDGQQYKYNLFLHNNPAKNNVPVTGEINFPAGKTVYLGINATGLEGCKNSSLAIGSLASFLVNNQLNVKGGTTNVAEANESNLTLVQCNLYPNNSVIIIQAGNETSIKETSGNGCYVVNVNNCEILEATEKFEVQSVIDAKNRTNS